jgi:predicted TIM-barrel fold metal-dependent hydrolase
MLVTTSGNYFAGAFECTRDALGMERILLATDYPYEEMDECLSFLEGLDLSVDEREMLYHGNAGQVGIA